MKTIYHNHHIVPRHMGGSDDASNLIYISIDQHAEEHRLLFEKYGKVEDYIAWRALSGQISMNDASKEAQLLGRSKGGKKGGKIAGTNAVKNKTGIHAKSAEWHRNKGKKCVENKIGIHKPGYDKSIGGKLGGISSRDKKLGIHKPGFNKAIQRGKIWITNNREEKFCYPDDIPYGWTRGRIPKK